MAVRSYIRANAPQDPGNVDKYIETVDQLTQWEDRHNTKDIVKTVSRMVQSFERVAIRGVVGLAALPQYGSYRGAVETAVQARPIGEDDDGVSSVGSDAIDVVACSMRRHDNFFDLLAASVAAEIVWADATNGTRSMARHIYERLEEKKREATLNLMRGIHSFTPRFDTDTVGLPLMKATANMCVSSGVLVVCPGMQSATYILDMEEEMDLNNVRTITITRVVREDEPPPR